MEEQKIDFSHPDINGRRRILRVATVKEKNSTGLFFKNIAIPNNTKMSSGKVLPRKEASSIFFAESEKTNESN